MIRRVLKTLIVLTLIPTLVIAVDPTAYILNTVGETLSKINLTTGEVENDILTIGTDVFCYPNQIVIRDTLAYVIASGTAEIQIIDLNSTTTVGWINTGENTNPFWMAFYDSQYVYVTLMMDNSIAKIDLTTGTIVNKIYTGISPAGIVIADHKAYVVCSGYDFVNYTYNPSVLAIYDLPIDTFLTGVDVGLNAQYAAVDTSGRVHVSVTGDYYNVFGEVFIVDVATDLVVYNFNIGGSPGQISISPDNIAYLAAAGWGCYGYVLSYNALTGEVYHNGSNPIEVDYNCMTAVAYQDSTVFTGSFNDIINVIDSGGNYLASYAVGDAPIHTAFNYAPGDINGDFTVDILDILYMINWKYKDGAEIPYPKWRANANADLTYDILDILHLIKYKYKDGPRPKVGPDWLY